MSKKPFELAFSIVLALLSIYVLVESVAMPKGRSGIGPGFFPALIASIMLALALINCHSIWRQPKDKSSVNASVIKRRVLIFSMAIAVVLLLPLLGFWISSVLFLVLYFSASTPMKWPIKLALSLGLSSVVWSLFVLVLSVPLPTPLFL